VSLRLRLLVLLVVEGAVPLGLAAWYASGPLPADLEARARTDLGREARLARSAALGRPFTDALADSLGEAAGIRVTLIGADGTVRGDSYVPEDRLGSVENHAGRPEVREALRSGLGTATRMSRTVGFSLLYAAVPDGRRIVRVAMPHSEVLAPAVHVRRALLAAAVAWLLFVAFLLVPAERWLGGPLRPVREALERLAEGRRDAEAVSGTALRVPGAGGGEPGRLARAAAGVADRLDRAERQRRQEEELLWVFDQMEDGVAVLDDRGTVVRTNRAFDRLAAPQETSGRPARSLFRDPAILDALDRGLAGDAAEAETARGDRTLLLSVRPHGERVLLLARDLTRLRRLEGVRRDFVANASHELKTPLTSILGFAETLQDADLPAERRSEFLERIRHNAARMRRLVDDLLDLSRIESGAWRPRSERIPVEAAARQAWDEVPRRGDGQVRLEVETSLAPAVDADRGAVDQVLRNLLDNALRYSPPDGVVRVESAPSDGRVRVTVTDQGPGIPVSQRERVFERFWRVDPGRSRAEGGTGLGLSIVRHLVAAHGGSVGIEGAPGEGATVWFTLPAPSPSP